MISVGRVHQQNRMCIAHLHMVYGVWCMMYGVWCMVYGVWCMVYGAHGVWCMVYGVWWMVCMDHLHILPRPSCPIPPQQLLSGP
jgi:hypothetical protein